MNAITTASAGLVAAGQRLDASAVRVATGDADPVAETVTRISARTAFDGDVAVLRTADQMLGSLLDLKV